MIEVDTDPDPDTVIAYVPAGVPFGLEVPPLEPQPIAMSASKRDIAPSGTNGIGKTRHLPTAQSMKSAIPRTVRILGIRTM